MVNRKRAILGLLCALALPLVVPLAGASGDGRTAEVYNVELVLVRGDGATVPVRVDVLAASSAAAEQLARASLQALSRAAVSAPTDGGVAAAWLPWSWKWDSTEIPVPIAYNPTGAPASVGPDAVVAGLQSWSSVATSSFRFRYAGVTENTASILQSGPDGENVISWASLPCERGCVLGITSKETTHEVDMLLNSNPEAALQLGVGVTLDWRTVILHELGHMAGLEHSCPVPFGPCTEAEAAAVMYFAYLGVLRKLAPDDIAGISALYPAGTGPAPTPATNPAPNPTPTPFPELTVIVERGWNLLVFPAGPVTTVTASLPCIDALYSYEEESWSAWIRALAAPLQGFSELKGGRAYWAWANATCAHVFP